MRPHVGARRPDTRSPGFPRPSSGQAAAWPTLPLRPLALIGGLGALAAVAYVTVEALVAETPKIARYAVHHVVNDGVTTVISCANDGHAPAAVKVTLFDNGRAAADASSATIKVGDTAAFSTAIVWLLRSNIIQVAPLRNGSAQITAPDGVQCSRVRHEQHRPTGTGDELVGEQGHSAPALGRVEPTRERNQATQPSAAPAILVPDEA